MLRVGFSLPASRAMISAALEGLTAANYVLLRSKHLPPLYRSGVRYRREQPGKEDWLTADQVLAKGYGDCEDLAAWRAAELRLNGIPARAVIRRTGAKKFHALVRWPDGSTEDPSRMLGMGKKKRA